jgi:hypothetical protein
MSISDYQRRKQLTAGNLGTVGANLTSRLVQSHKDYQRRRSVSPFTSRESLVPTTPTSQATAHTKYNFNGNLYFNPTGNNNAANKIVNSAKYSREVCSNLVSEAKAASCASATLYAKNYNKKHFASSEDLCSATGQKSRKLIFSPFRVLLRLNLAKPSYFNNNACILIYSARN